LLQILTGVVLHGATSTEGQNNVFSVDEKLSLQDEINLTLRCCCTIHWTDPLACSGSEL